MVPFIGTLLIFINLILGFFFWAVVKAKARINDTLKRLYRLGYFGVRLLSNAGFFEKSAAEASDATGKASHSTGKMWEMLLASGAGYPTVINIEIEAALDHLEF